MRKLILSLISATFLLTIPILNSCKKEEVKQVDTVTVTEEESDMPDGTQFVPASTQRNGDASAGYDYLTLGAYLKSGIPYDIYTGAFGTDPTNELGRMGDNANINYAFTAVDAPNGVRVVAANCLQCHAQKLNGTLIVGLGNATADFTTDQSANANALDIGVQFTYGASSPEWNAYYPFSRALKATGPHIITEVKGANPADKLAAVLAAHRNKDDLTWIASPTSAIPSEVVPSDVPPWWLLKKKNAMFYSASGRGDFGKFLMASNLLTVSDTSEANEVNNHFDDVLAYIYSLTPPAYPMTIDNDLANRGKVVFQDNCSSCHGTYGVDECYPNLLVDLDKIKTDPLLAQSNFAYSEFVDWYNTSWFSKNPFAAYLDPLDGYIAPPLDGIWASAPYLHNGSVPTLESLLNSSTRPTFWERSFGTMHSDYDFDEMGWIYSEKSDGSGSDTYDTTLPGYGNEGHTFGDGLSNEDRMALIEYLKTL